MTTPTHHPPDPDSDAFFLTTQWTQVMAAKGSSPGAQQAMSDLCAAYYTPVVAYLKGAGRSEDVARDLAHEFFARLLERHGLDNADPARGRFRSYLLGAVKHFLANHAKRAGREKRGGSVAHESLSTDDQADGTRDVPDLQAEPADRVFDREWAVNILNCVLNQLAEEADQGGTRSQFEALKAWLTPVQPGVTQSEVAESLGISQGALRVAIYRLRRRFRNLVKTQIASTVEDPADVESELRYLIGVLGESH